MSTSPPRTPFWKSPFVIAFVVGAVALTILPFIQRQFLSAPPPIAPLGSWELVDENGKPFGSADLKGTVWIANFWSSQCTSPCREQHQDLGKILKHIDDLVDKPGVAPIELVTFTFTPDVDGPEQLAAAAKELGAPAGRWKHITGDRARVEDLLVNRFLPALGATGKKNGTLPDLAHASKFVLVDQNGDVRGAWDTDELARGNLINAARLLAKSGPRP